MFDGRPESGVYESIQPVIYSIKEVETEPPPGATSFHAATAGDNIYAYVSSMVASKPPAIKPAAEIAPPPGKAPSAVIDHFPSAGGGESGSSGGCGDGSGLYPISVPIANRRRYNGRKRVEKSSVSVDGRIVVRSALPPLPLPPRPASPAQSRWQSSAKSLADPADDSGRVNLAAVKKSPKMTNAITEYDDRWPPPLVPRLNNPADGGVYDALSPSFASVSGSGTVSGTVSGSAACGAARSVREYATAADVPATVNVERFTIDDVAHCLDLLRLGRYAADFHEKDVDGALLVNLDEEILTSDEFGFSRLAAKKFIMFAKNGWRPT